jgi:hypothetical protein
LDFIVKLAPATRLRDLAKVIDGVKFVNGEEVPQPDQVAV